MVVTHGEFSNGKPPKDKKGNEDTKLHKSLHIEKNDETVDNLTLGDDRSRVFDAASNLLNKDSRVFDAGSQLLDEDSVFDNELYQSMFRLANEAIFVFPIGDDGRPGAYVRVNPAACELLGYTEHELLQLSPVDITPTSRHSGIPDLLARIYADEKLRFEGAYIRKTGETVPLEFSATKLNVHGKTLVVSFARNITQEKTALAKLQESEQLYRTLVETSPLLITVLVNGRIVFVNQTGAQIIGGSKPEQLVGRSMWDFIAQEEHDRLRPRLRALSSSRRINPPVETKLVNLDGQIIHVESRTSLIQYGNRPAILAVIQDITERRQSQQLIWNMAYRDQLTNLYNRRAFVEQLQEALQSNGLTESASPSEELALFFLDIDRFKVVNDTFGHAAGDELLSQVADRLRELTPSSAFVARLGGDEFTILLRQPRDGMEQLSRDIITGLNTKPFCVHGQEILVTASLGATQFSFSDEIDADLLRQADVAMYEAKRQGGNNVSWYKSQNTIELPMRRLKLEGSMYRALHRGEFSLVYQPKVNTRTGSIAGLEVLLRWTSPEFGEVSPDEFIPIAEENGLIVPLGHWVIRSVCTQLEEWNTKGISVVPVAVNLSPRQFRSEDFFSVVRETLNNCHLQGTVLEFEITERSLMDNTRSTSTRMRQLRNLGVSFSIDDFGVGYSSLAYLKRFPIDVLKIDQSFVKDLDTDATNRQIVMAMIQLAHNLGLQVIAEGVEYESQRVFFQSHHCDMIQGYLISQPKTPQEIEALL
ncbi:bifunctional diguanylate cyclase/phosphodiesterase [Alicyclobacillus sp. SO9]|uniref:putative bifunctional diguanylate cyclase/phosphodiesterase n=1 Tax=Alicyclobacillus sp. SO9 TaxID=2665646 RepID=UPI0018E7E554|nr:EAL domain-containing protein [Alicyclobacillus sp. SO9]